MGYHLSQQYTFDGKLNVAKCEKSIRVCRIWSIMHNNNYDTGAVSGVRVLKAESHNSSFLILLYKLRDAHSLLRVKRWACCLVSGHVQIIDKDRTLDMSARVHPSRMMDARRRVSEYSLF